MGAGLLYHLAEEGCTDALLLEKGELTSGSTWHAAGQCPSLVGNYNLAKIHAHGHDLYPRLESITGQYVSWHASGGIRFARTQKDLDWFQHMRGIAARVGFRMEVIDKQKIQQLCPHLTLDGVLGGAWTLDDGHADPAGLCNAMARGATNMGARIKRHTLVTGLSRLPSGDWEVQTDKGTVHAEIVVNAAGCFARQVAKWVGADLPICNIEHHYLVTGTVDAFLEADTEIPVIRDPYASCYIRQEQKSGLIGIYEGENITEAWQPNGFPPWESDSELFTDDLDRLMPWLGRALERMPILEDAGIKKIVNGAIPHPADGPPMLGPVAGVPNYWMCCGSSFGIAQGAGSGKYLAQWMLYGDSEINMTGFDPRRFGTFADDAYMKAKGMLDYARTYATPLPGEEIDVARNNRLSPLYDKLKQQGAVFTETFGWERPKYYAVDDRNEDWTFRRSNIVDVVAAECRAVQERAGILDLSGFAKYDVSGPDAEAYLNRLCANKIPTRAGGITLTHVLTDKLGRIAGEMTITRMSDNHYYVLSAAGAELRDLDHLEQGRQHGENVTIENVTDARGVLVLAGPKSREILASVTDTPLDNEHFPWLTGRDIEINGKTTRALRVNYVGELGWELHPQMTDLEAVYDALWLAGQAHGITNFGLYAVNSLRIEKAYKGWGAELTNEVTMLDADMGRFLKLEKPNFVGKAATEREAKEERALQIIYFEVDAEHCDIHGSEPIFYQGECVGLTTSGGYGHRVDKNLGFGYVPGALADSATEFQVMLLGELCTLRTLDKPAYDPSNQRLRA